MKFRITVLNDDGSPFASEHMPDVGDFSAEGQSLSEAKENLGLFCQGLKRMGDSGTQVFDALREP